MVKKQRILIVILLIYILSISLFSCKSSNVSSETLPNFVIKGTNTVNESDTDNSNNNIVNLIMVGDILLHEKVVDSATKSDGTYDFSPIFSHLKNKISSADYAIANQEVILGGSEIGISGYPCFNGPYEVADSLVDAGFDIIAHGTNHALDKGKIGIINCINYWNSTYPNIKVLGINLNQENQDTVCIIEKKGIKIAFLNYTYGTNGISLPEGMPYAVNYLDESKVISDLEYAETNSDFTVVLPHWGTEYIHSTDSTQEYWTELFVKYGADLIIGTHPHVIEPVEWYETSGNKALVYYSLGNFVSCTAESGTGKCDRMLGAVADVNINKDENGAISISDFSVIPIVTHVESGFGGISVYYLSDYTEEMANNSYTSQIDSTFSISYYKNLCLNTFGEFYK